jgi:hypothetical protein
MAITRDEVITLVRAFHETVMIKKGTAEDQAAFFLYPESRIYIPHGQDVTLQTNYEIHQRLTDEVHVPVDEWDIIPVCDDPERVRAVGAIYWEGRVNQGAADAVLKCIVGEDWIVQRLPSGALKIALYINPYHYFLPDSARIDLR